MASSQQDRKSEKVEHNYRDHAHIVEEDLSGASKPANASDRHFPVKMHYMLAELEQDGLDHIVSWQPHGRAFVVHNQAEFVRTILPTWFRQTKFASFQRQLNLYGFKRLTTGRDKNGYYHELFLRGKRFLAHRIPRCKLKGQGARKPTSPETEPNFYLYSFLPMEQSNDRSEDSPQTNATGGPAGTSVTSSGTACSRPHPSLSLEQILLSNAGVPLPQQHASSSSCRVPVIGQLTGQLAGQLPGRQLSSNHQLTGHQLGLPSRSLFLEVLAASLTQGNRMFMDQRAPLMQGRLGLSSMGGMGSQQHPHHQQSLLDSLALCSQQRSASSLSRVPPPALSDLLSADLALRMALSRDARSPAANNASALN